MEAANKKLIIFDFDGVFNLNSMEAYYHCYDIALWESGAQLDSATQKQVIDENWGSSHREIIVKLLEESKSRGISHNKKLFGMAVEAFENVLAEDFAEIIKPIPGASQMLGRLASKYTLSLNTAADPEVLLEKVMPKLDIDPRVFEGGMLMALDFMEDERAKPKPDPYSARELMSRNGVQPHETVMVGDSSADIESALYAGIDDVIVPLTGKLTLEEAQEYEVITVPDVRHVEHILGGMSIKSCLGVESSRGLPLPTSSYRER